MHPIHIGLTKALALSTKLGNYYIEHPKPDNKILMTISLFISAHCMALEHLVQAPVLNDTVVLKMIKVIESLNPEEAELLEKTRKLLPDILPEHRGNIRQEFADRFVEALNMMVDTGRTLLKSRELQNQGASEAEFQKASEEPSGNIF